MGRIRNKMVKRASRQMIEKHYARLTFDFHTNKRVADEVAEVPSKRVRNQIAGYVSHLMKRIQRGPVRGISLKLQEEERERRLDFLPEKSFADVDRIDVDKVTAEMVDALKINLDLNVAENNNRRRNHKSRK